MRDDILARVSRIVHKLLSLIAPIIYKSYMQLIFYTSKKTFINFDSFWKFLEGGGNAIGAIVHQDILLGYFTFRGRSIVTLASRSRDGDISTRVLEKSGFIPIRGSSSRGGIAAIKELIAYVNARGGVLTGITVDGPRGPSLEPKMGVVLIAKATGAPIYPIRAWAKRKHLFSSWDRTLLPLPFNHLVFICGDPIYVPGDAGKSAMEEIRLELQKRLAELSERAKGFFNARALTRGLEREATGQVK